VPAGAQANDTRLGLGALVFVSPRLDRAQALCSVELLASWNWVATAWS
jgi:hypothetical protein